MRLLLMLSLVLAGCGMVRKPPDPDRRLDVRTSGALFESDTGYRFAALPEPGNDIIRVTVRYPVGSADDPQGKEGLAHLVEHLLYQVEVDREGTRTSIGAELGRIALWSNASTASDATDYEALIAPEALEALLRLEVERLAVGCAGLTRAIVDREREVVLNELRQRQGANGAELHRQINDAVFPAGHPYRAVDSVDSVSKLTLEDVCGFLVGPYRRGKVIVVASGAVDAAALQTAAGKHLARAPKRTAPTRQAPPLVTPQSGTVRLRGDVEQLTLLATWPLPRRASHEYRMVEMATGAIPRRLEGFGLTYQWGNSAYATILGGPHAPVLAVGVTLRSTDDLDEAKSAVAKSAEYAIRSMSRPGDDRDTPNWRYLWQGRAEAVLARWESLGSRNELAADIMQLAPNDQFVVGRIDELVKAHPQEVHALAKTWLAPSRARFILIEPATATPAARHATYAGGDEAHATFVDASLADKPLPAPRAAATFRTERYETENGIKVILWPHGSAPIVNGRLIIDSGTAHEPAGKEGISSFVGAGDIDDDTMTFSDRQLATRVDDLVESLALELRNPGYELDDEVKNVMRGQLKLARAKERMRYARDYLTALYGASHPYARNAITEDSLDNISRDAVMSWARSHIVPRNAALVIAGRFDPALVKKHITYNTDQISGGSKSKDPDAEPAPKRSFIAGTTDKPSPTVQVEVGFVAGSGIDRDHAKRLVLAGVLDAQLAQLRAKRAISYGLQASYTPRRAGGMWSIYGEVDAARAAEAATTITTILDELRANPEAYRTAFVLARQRVLESLLVNTTSSSTVVARLASLAEFDLPDNFYETLARQVAALTLANFHGFVTTELAANGQVFGAFGNADAVDAAIKAARAVQPTPQTKIVDPFGE